MTKFGRSTTISWLFFGVLVLAGTSRHRRAHPKSNRLPRPMALIPTGKLKRCAIRSTSIYRL